MTGLQSSHADSDVPIPYFDWLVGWFLPLLWAEVVIPDRVLSMVQIELFDI